MIPRACHHIRPLPVLVVVAGLFATTAFAQVVTTPTVAAEKDKAPAPVSRDYRIGPGDHLTISVSGLNELGHSARVSNTGKIHVPQLGILRIAGLTTAELEALISKQLRERGLVNNAWVSVRVDQYRAQPVYVLGEVMTPGQFVIKDEIPVHPDDLGEIRKCACHNARDIQALNRRFILRNVFDENESEGGSSV